MGDDGPPDSTDGHPLSEEALRDMLWLVLAHLLYSLVTRIKLVAHRLGLSTDDYAGATDLFVARVPYFIIKRMGRWSSDAAMIYYCHEEDVVKTVAAAFQFVATPAHVSGGRATGGNKY